MTPEQLTRATFLCKRLDLYRKAVREWGEHGNAISVSVQPDEYSFADVEPVVVTDECAKRVLREVFSHLKAKVEEIEVELSALGIEFEPCQMIVGDVSIGHSLQ